MRLVRNQRDGVLRHHVRPVRKIGDLAEALGFALGKEIAVRHVQPHQRRIGSRRNPGFDLEHEGGRHRIDRQGFIGLHKLWRAQWLAVECKADQLQALTLQQQRRSIGAHRVAPERDARRDDSGRRIELEREINRVNQIGWWCVIGKKNRLRSGIVHAVARRGNS